MSRRPRVFSYSKCSTCRSAVRFLKEHGIAHDVRDLIETPPSLEELIGALEILGDRKKLFNTSGEQYRALGLAEKLPTMSDDDALKLLAKNGKLIKRPLVIWGGGDARGEAPMRVLVGFKEDQWKAALAPKNKGS